MATGTFTIQKPPVRPTRTYDYLYDPVFTVSSERDHIKQSFQAQTSVDRVKQVPEFKTMFSSLRHYPRSTLRLETTDPVPAHVNRHWRGYAEQMRQSIIRYTKFNYDPTVKVPPVYHQDPQVDGQNRYRYFRRPIIPFLQQMPPNVVLEQTKTVDPMVPPTVAQGVEDVGGGTRTVYVQTDYRDSETQTDPYTPPYVVKPGEQPELLTLANLSWGHGLPAGLAEVEMIERARAKREWEATLPPLGDPEQKEKRRRMMEEQERKEWAFREKEIQKLQEERMVLLDQMLKRREADSKALTEKRLEHLWGKKQMANHKETQRLRKHHIQALRKLSEKHKNVEGKLERRDAIKDYSTYSSQVYAPMTRIGVFLDSSAHQYQVSSHYKDTLYGILELEAGLPTAVIKPKLNVPSRDTRVVGYKARQKKKLVAELDKEYQEIIKDQRSLSAKKELRFLEKVEKPRPRPPTPFVDPEPEDVERRELAVTFLQKVIRGRAIQSKMFEGKERRLELIHELRTTHALQEAGQKLKEKEKSAVLDKQLHQDQKTHKDSVVGDVVEDGPAELIGKQLDFLNKELIRLQEERRIHAFAMLAERQRRMREAEESGHRQVEERIRRQEDEIFRQVMLVHQSTVDSYLEDVIMDSMKRTADHQAREEIQEQAKRINKIALELEESRNELESKELVAEMVTTFLLPEVEKKTLREKVHEHQRRHILAAHRLVHKVIEHTPTDYSLPTAEEVSKEPTSSADPEQDQPETNQELHS